jgi:hypothetical protein
VNICFSESADSSFPFSVSASFQRYRSSDEQEEAQREGQRTRVVKPDRRLPAEGIRQPSQYEIACNRPSAEGEAD